MNKKILVTKSSIPDLDEYDVGYVEVYFVEHN